jgi:hypothetical protein
MLGEATLATNPEDPSAGRRIFAEAAELARRQAVPMLGLRVAMSQARLEASLREPETAARLLQSAIAAIREPDNSCDIKEANALYGSIYGSVRHEGRNDDRFQSAS